MPIERKHDRQKKQSRLVMNQKALIMRKERLILNSMIVGLAVINLWIFTLSRFTKLGINRRYEYAPGYSPMRLAPFPPSINYSEDELKEAIDGLNLPTKSRGYVNCTSPESEVTCSQIVRAWRKISQWVAHESSVVPNSTDYVLTRHYFDGVGNRMSIDTFVFLLSMMSNRSMVVEGNYLQNGFINETGGNAYDYHPYIRRQSNFYKEILASSEINPPHYINTFDGFWFTDFYGLYGTRRYLDIDRLMYATMVYAQYQLAPFCIENFGMHGIYFMSNFLIRMPKEVAANVQKILSAIPRTVRVFGVHLRFQFPGQFYSYSVKSTMDAVTPFLRSKLLEKPTVFAFASDSKEMEIAFKAEFGKHMIQTNAVRRADFDHVTALYDIEFLSMCDECLITYRSTFSFAIASRMGKRCWFVERESPSVFQASNSQATALSLLFHNWDVNDWQTNRRFRLTPGDEEYMRYYFKYFML